MSGKIWDSKKDAMPSERQVAVWVARCLEEHMRPDAVVIQREDTVIRVTTRKVGTYNQEGEVFRFRVEREERR